MALRKNLLLDALTIFFLVSESLLLWLNIRRRPSDVVLTRKEDGDSAQPFSTTSIP